MLELWHSKRLIQIPLFSGYTSEGIFVQMREIHYRVRLYKKGAIIARQNTPCTHLMILLDGHLMAGMTDHNEKKVTVEYLEAPRLIAPAFLFGKSAAYPVDIEARTVATLITIPKKELLSLLTKNPQMLNSYLDLISNRAQFLSKRLLYLSSKSIEEKVITYLRELYTKQRSRTILIPLSITDLSELFAVTRPALSRVLKNLCERHLMTRTGRAITIINEKFLGVRISPLA